MSEVRITLRMPESIRDEITAAAERNGRSMNSEIIARLSGDTETLRDKFAIEAMNFTIGEVHSEQTGTYADAAARAYEFADAMLRAREGGGMTVNINHSTYSAMNGSAA